MNPPAVEEPAVSSALTKALNRGDIGGLTDAAALLQAATELANVAGAWQQTLLQSLYSGASTAYAPGRSSQWIQVLDSETAMPFVVGDKGHSLAGLSTAEGGRSAAYGSDILASVASGNNSAHINTLNNLVAWLIRGDASASVPAALNVSWLGFSSIGNRDNALALLGSSITSQRCDSLDAACGADADLLIISAHLSASTALHSKVVNHLRSGLPILYVHTRGWNSTESNNQILNAMQLSIDSYGGNWWSNDVANDRSPAENWAQADQHGILLALLERIQQGRFDYDWSACVHKVGTTSCNAVPQLNKEIIAPINAVRRQINAYNSRGENLFTEGRGKIIKYLALWADLTRRDINYPLDKAVDDGRFLNTLAADSWLAYVRSNGEGQTDLGNFLQQPGRMSASQNAETVAVTTSASSGFTAVGRFALPGKTFTVRAIDLNGATVKIRLNSQRGGSTRLWNQNHYNRPLHLRSSDMVLREGETLSINSPYGGYIQLVYNGSQSGEQVLLSLAGTATHPFLDLTQTTSTDDFSAGINSGIFEWAEIKSDFAEIHTKIGKMATVLNGDYANDLDRYLDDLANYFFNDAYQLAGFSSDKFTLKNSVLSFCRARAWNCTDSAIHRVPSVQHINVDEHAACGGGCSGNPYDQTWGLHPFGWGESHELGHNLQVGRLKINGVSAEVSNQVFPLHKNWRLFNEKGLNKSATRVKYQSVYNILNSARTANNPLLAAYDGIWADQSYAANNGERMAFYMQWVHYWADRNNSSDGWDIYTLLYLQERLFAKGQWNSVRASLGFSQYSDRPSIDGNDFMLISLSWITQRDQRAIFELWGVSYSEKASAQVASFNFTTETAFLYVASSTNDHSTARRLDMTGNPSWPF